MNPDGDRQIRLAITRGMGITVTDPKEIALREALADLYIAEGFGGREDAVTTRDDADRLVAERLDWLRAQRKTRKETTR